MVKKKGEDVKKVLITGGAGLVCIQKPEPSRDQSINERKPNYCRREENSEIPRSREARLTYYGVGFSKSKWPLIEH